MKLEEFINESIYAYPTLYRSFNHEESRLLVLGHMFLAYGTGLEWNPDGYLEYIYDDADEDRKNGMESLPEGFYDMDLWYIDCPKNKIEELKKELGDIFYYFKSGYAHGNRCCIFSVPEKRALEITEMFEDDKVPPVFRPEGFKRTPKEATSFGRKHRHNINGLSRLNEKYYMDGYSPCPMCKYSPIVEMVYKQTNSSHIDNFKLVNIRPDWIKGALDISHYCIDWYSNKKNYKYLSAYPPRSIKECKARYDEDPGKYRSERLEGNMQWSKTAFTDDMTIEDYCEARWQHFLDDQMGYFHSIIKMYELA